MDTLAEIYKRHSGGSKFNDKGSTHSYIQVYEDLFDSYRETARKIIEIGLYDGHSFRMFSEYFNGDVYGIDISEQPLDMVDLMPVLKSYPEYAFICDGANANAVESYFPAAKFKFDVVIDDAAHTLDQQLKIFGIWKERLAPHGIHVVEDIQDIDRYRHCFEALGFEILDLRHVKNRYDDVLAVFRN